MKIRFGFVSNSSSSSFTTWHVALPKNLKIDKDKLRGIHRELDFDDDTWSEKEILNLEQDLLKASQQLQEHGCYADEDSSDDELSPICETLVKFFESEGLFISGEANTDEGHNIVVISAKDLDLRLTKLQSIRAKYNS